MFVFGHMGIGAKLVSPWSEGLKLRWILAGTLLPDVIDKPLYYGLSWAYGQHGQALGLISGTRTFGHTAALMLAIAIVSYFRRSRVLAAVALGIATHLLLDNLGDHFGRPGSNELNLPYGTLYALCFPVLGWRFPYHPFSNATEHLSSFTENAYVVGGEVIGLALLGWEWWKSAYRVEILEQLRDRRFARRKRKQLRKR
jgi:hypothetical protein